MNYSAIREYLAKQESNINPAMLAYLSSLSLIAERAPAVAASIVRELGDQRNNLKLIASENYSSPATQLAMGNLLTDKYAEGFPYHRFYAGCQNVDEIESFACKRACELFGAEHAYVQPHSGADANMIAFWAILHTRVGSKLLEKFGQTKLTDLSDAQWAEFRSALGSQKLLGHDYASGGHLTHGYRYNVSAQMFEAHSYTVSKETGLLDYDQIEAQALELKPLILLAGYSAYPRALDFRRLREIADKAGAVLMVDMAHFAGLVAGKVFSGDNNPVEFADVVTSTTHKTLRGPRGGLILCRKEFAEQVDKGCPLVIGGPLPHVLAAKAVAFSEALSEDFKDYAGKIVLNAKALAKACIDEGMQVLTGGTDNHIVLIDVTNFGITGRQAEEALRECGITLNRNSIPFDPNGAWYTSGLRLGTPALTTLGMSTGEMPEIAAIIKLVLTATQPAVLKSGKPGKSKYQIDDKVKAEARARTGELLRRYPVYPELDLEYLMSQFC
ncbi:MAG: glycine hydroxymethyltransferase [Candidatus Dadabacteria bacterium]|nr:MAG: glycine hydroxymethyltransferase [Candidatus Dadabacteria bacterium]